MATLQIPVRSRKTARRTHPMRTAMRDFETTLNRLPVASRLTQKKSLGRRMARPLAHLSKTQRTVVLSVAAGTAFIAVDALVAGIVIRYARRQRANQEATSTSETGRTAEVPDEVVVEESLVEEFARTATTS